MNYDLKVKFIMRKIFSKENICVWTMRDEMKYIGVRSKNIDKMMFYSSLQTKDFTPDELGSIKKEIEYLIREKSIWTKVKLAVCKLVGGTTY